jgi:hypothetical protein
MAEAGMRPSYENIDRKVDSKRNAPNRVRK